MTSPETPGRRKRYAQIYVSPDVAKRIDAARIQLIVRTEREWTKTQVNDALITFALDHLDEVAALLNARQEDTPDE
jgi:lysyl-tRNA synthetase class I